MTQKQEIKAIEVSSQLPVAETSGIMSVIERVALDPNVDIAKLEKMLDLQERILNRNAEQAFASAFARMQAELPIIDEKGKIVVNREVRSTYAEYEDIIEAIRPVLFKYGFSLSHRIQQAEGKIKITAILRHEQGHSDTTEFEGTPDTSGGKSGVHASNSTVSYGKRITTNAILGIATRGEDDDGQGAVSVDTEQAANIDNLIRNTKTDRTAFFKYMGVNDVREIKAADYQKAVSALNKKAKTNAA